MPLLRRANDPQRVAIADLGSNSFRLVVITYSPDYYKLSDEIREPVRIGAGMGEDEVIRPDRIQKAASTVHAFSGFIRAAGIEHAITVGTSAIRSAVNRDEVLAALGGPSGLAVQVLDAREEAWYGYLAAVNSTTLADGFMLDVGGGSLQAVQVADRLEQRHQSWPLGAVRVSERFLPDERATDKQIKALRKHVRQQVKEAGWLDAGGGPHVVGVGGTVRNLAGAALRAEGHPLEDVQGYELTAAALDDLISELADRPASERAQVPGIKPDRADIILGGALVLRTIMEVGSFEAIEVTHQGLREGLFYEHYLKGDPPLIDDVRARGVENLANIYRFEPEHVRHVATLSLSLFDRLGELGLHSDGPAERELLWAACMLHDIGVTIDYDDHHKHSRYLVMNAGLPGFTPREVALIAQATRYHRRGEPSLNGMDWLARNGDADLVVRLSALIRLSEQLERSRDQTVRSVGVEEVDGDAVCLDLVARGDPNVAVWSVERQAALFERAFGRRLELAVSTG